MTGQRDNTLVDKGRRNFVIASGAVGAVVGLEPKFALGKTLAGVNGYDVVIVGGGSAGAALAYRLSGDPARRVLLIEAGKAYQPEEYPDPVRLQTIIGGDPAHDWGFTSEPGWAGKAIPVPRGKVLGGSSAINGAVAMRAHAGDFRRWAEAGLPNWSHDEVVPFYKLMERTSHGSDALHGRSGPWPIHQLQWDEISDMQRAFIGSAEAAGYKRVTDFNGDDPFGVGPYPMNTRIGNRLNTGMTYLGRGVRARPNLTIRSETLVDRLEIQDNRAPAVVLAGGERIEAGEVVLAAGTYGSAALLMRSGIGPAKDLSALDIPVVADLPVGTRLQDHPFFFTTWAAHPERLGLPIPPVGALLWGKSSLARPDDLDTHVTAVHYGDPKSSPTGGIFMLAVANTRPQARGSVRLRDRNPASAPAIALNLLGEAEDRQRLMDGIEIVRRIVSDGPLKEIVADEMVPGPSIRDRAALESALPMALDTYHHPTSTAPMGADGDPHAVVDWQGRVKGVGGLRVADASIFPDVPSVATNPTVIMAAERIAAWMMA
ncbi:choline dehydrogenase [Mesorhizobium albiziae]|uniref:Choline dehydrogenase n=1 Tax=Neomesorhizobium albiziae TaxID=335020 RepID=A0A1I4ETH2_9HYPH|nr:GMC family oxidoreductase N-terminal domain-containing protein [Mesorhizobium albiziae]GLS32665.1 dehydrogenase [Mesorhizobium albiziae]SFL09025.1 choline dehydrogenase [Mesorhizobium albiziae]